MTYVMKLVGSTGGEYDAPQSVAYGGGDLRPDDVGEEIEMLRHVLGYCHKGLICLQMGKNAIEQRGEW